MISVDPSDLSLSWPHDGGALGDEGWLEDARVGKHHDSKQRVNLNEAMVSVAAAIACFEIEF